jgi:hypothetical protein
MNNAFNGMNENNTPVRILVSAGILVILTSAFFGWLMTSFGLVLTRILPAEALISQQALSYLLAFVVHATLVILYITLSRSLGNRRINSSLSLLLPFAVLLMITVYFSFLSISYEAKGTATLDKVLFDIRALDQKITQSDYYIKSTFSTKIDALEKLARDSDRGFDETAIATCGPICKRYLNQRAELLSRFSLLTQELPTKNLDADNDVNEAWRFVGARYDSLLKKLSPFDEFLREAGMSSASWLELKDQFAKVQETFRQKDSVDKISLVTNRVNNFLKTLFATEKMNEDASFFLFLILACLPEAINFSIMLALASLQKEAQMPTKDLEQTLEDEKKRFRLMRELITTRNLHNLFRKVHGKVFRNYAGNNK